MYSYVFQHRQNSLSMLMKESQIRGAPELVLWCPVFIFLNVQNVAQTGFKCDKLTYPNVYHIFQNLNCIVHTKLYRILEKQIFQHSLVNTVHWEIMRFWLKWIVVTVSVGIKPVVAAVDQDPIVHAITWTAACRA